MSGTRRWLRRLIILAATGSVACRVDQTEPLTSYTLGLGGTVTDQSTGGPISGAVLTVLHNVGCDDRSWFCTKVLTAASATTDLEGRYHLSFTGAFQCDVVALNFWVKASAPGYQTREAGSLWSSPLLCTGAPQSLDFALAR
jgi:hypothetical protein